ncbi:thioredoxin-dependent thiol peroxidase [uncultured Cohaesibacter sp.]|uniref:thioredoxin-dependent thiol peroxidase n=1 Tax=uncultured Cohaesibacter sp. TaxID=1002546 RepID=UPI0029315BB5|nr:thioredoxin-dependent thiol peroxidase [uncultured Cohaesibacter sp.]
MSDNSEKLCSGTSAPDFTLQTNDGGNITLSELNGKWVIVYFYPKDSTPGCTTEALDFTQLKQDFDAIGATIIGISPDSVKKHDNFITKNDLKITLASDPETKTCEDYGVWVEKKMYGKTYMGVERSSFLIDPKGQIVEIWRKVKVKGHAAEVLEKTRNHIG